MSFEEEHIDKIIKSNLDDLEIIPDDSSWDNLEKILLKGKSNSIRNKIGIVSVIILMLGFFIVWSFNHTNSKSVLNKKNIDSVGNMQLIEPDSVTIDKSTTTDKSRNNKSSVYQNQKTIELELTGPIVQDSVDKINENAVIAVDTANPKAIPVQNVVIKRVIKKPMYVVQQDTIFKVDTLSKKKKR